MRFFSSLFDFLLALRCVLYTAHDFSSCHVAREPFFSSQPTSSSLRFVYSSLGPFSPRSRSSSLSRSFSYAFIYHRVLFIQLFFFFFLFYIPFLFFFHNTLTHRVLPISRQRNLDFSFPINYLSLSSLRIVEDLSETRDYYVAKQLRIVV